MKVTGIDHVQLAISGLCTFCSAYHPHRDMGVQEVHNPGLGSTGRGSARGVS
jgi:hypothetical protein